MEEKSETSIDSTSAEPLSPRPTAFTIDFDDKKVDLQRHKSLAEKFQQRHKRGKSMSKLEGSPASSVCGNSGKKHPLTGNLPRKASFQSEDERPERCKSANVTTTRRSDLTLPLQNVTSDRMTHSFPNAALMSLDSPSGLCDLLNNVSSPEFELISPFSPKVEQMTRSVGELDLSPEKALNSSFSDTQDFDKKSDTISETGTYTIDNDNYTEEQKARMSIDNEFKIEKLSVEDKTMEYIKSLAAQNFLVDDTSSSPFSSQISGSSSTISSLQSSFSANGHASAPSAKPQPQLNNEIFNLHGKRLLSPILSPTQNLSLVASEKLPSPVPIPRVKSAPSNIEKQKADQGSIISVTSSGVFRSKNEDKQKLERKLSLTKSEVHVEAYVDGKIYNEEMLNNTSPRPTANRKSKLTANIVNVQSIEVNPSGGEDVGSVVSASFSFGKTGNVATVTTGLPPPTPTSPTKIPSPLHTLSRPRSRNSVSALPDYDFDTETILKPTRNYINSLQHKLSLDNSDQDSDYEQKYGLQLNNTAHLMKQRALHIRHNSLDDKTINNKLEHFQTKNLQPIDQTYTNVFGQYPIRQKVVNKINNSPSNSPIRRSSSFSNRNQMNNGVKSSNVVVSKDSNLRSSPNLGLQKSSSTACIKPGSGVREHRKIDRNKFGDTETSSEDDLEANVQRRKDLGSLSNTRCNRTFSLRRARVDNNEASKPKCPNTPDMRRKTFQPPGVKQERAISVDRKPVKTNEVQSRYLLSLNKRAASVAKEVPKTVTRNSCPPPATRTSSTFNRSEGGRFSMRTPKSFATNVPPKSGKKDGKSSKQNSGPRSNSSLTSREVEFQNWKRRKSYDPMKAAAEGKKKELEKRLGGVGAVNPKTGTVSPESSPSHSAGSVHRSQSFHGTAALEQLISSDEEDLTFSADEGFSPPTPSPCELSPTKANLRHSFWDRIRN